MKFKIFRISLFGFLLLFYACDKISPDAVSISVDFTWGKRGENIKNPEIKLMGVPPETKFLEVELIDRDIPPANHGGVERITYDGNGVIPSGALKNYLGPAPPPHGHLYEFTVKALDAEKVIIGIGKKAKKCCPPIPN